MAAFRIALEKEEEWKEEKTTLVANYEEEIKHLRKNYRHEEVKWLKKIAKWEKRRKEVWSWKLIKNDMISPIKCAI